MKLTDDQTRALANIAVGRDGEIFQRMLETTLAESDATCRTAEGADLFRAQGRSQYVMSLLKAFDEAKKRMRLTH